ncbi:MAG: hypothetical protein JKY08_00585 [Flavobacteriaceae bacterium]|nr:hypothetical protein [Flavobacteriaceae bacterium]
MFAVIDKRASEEVKDTLKLYVDGVFEFSSEGITYNSISGHPDVFMFQEAGILIVAPNAPSDFISFLQKRHVNFTFGKEKVGVNLKESSRYNCLATASHYFLRKGFTDRVILDHCKDKIAVVLPQSYVRCSLFNVDDHHFITSDKGILKRLNTHQLEACYFDPRHIKIKDHAYGFLGGTVGEFENTLFFMGDVLKHADGEKLQEYIRHNNKKVLCLGSDYLYDGGGVFFVK